jgi:hypothetical protein
MMTDATVFPSTTETMTKSKGEEVAMRFRKAFLSSAVLAAAGLLAAPAVMAADLPYSCTAGIWTVTLTAPPAVGASGVTATYKVEGPPGSKPDHVVGLMPLTLTEVYPANQVYDPGIGDPVLGLGLGDMSRKAFKVNPAADVSLYTVTVAGSSLDLGLVPVRIKKGSKGTAIEGACALAGPTDTGANPYATFSETFEEVVGGHCTVRGHRDPVTHEWIVELTPGSPCTESTINPGDVLISVNGDPAPLLYSEGLSFVLGTGTCIYKQYYPNNGPIKQFCW